jgi:8-oxo-dGTP diphosphatase
VSFHIRVSARGIGPSIPDVDPNNSELISIPKWVEISSLKDINYLPYIHENLMEYIKTNNFLPLFIEEPLEK